MVLGREALCAVLGAIIVSLSLSPRPLYPCLLSLFEDSLLTLELPLSLGCDREFPIRVRHFLAPIKMFISDKNLANSGLL